MSNENEQRLVRIHEHGGQWPEYIVSEDWEEAWYIGVEIGPIRTGDRLGETNYQLVTLGDGIDPDDIPLDAVIEIVSEEYYGE